jgi:cytoplasmic iron level regulating protein YaaA (DUF328/UPF0246 family)
MANANSKKRVYIVTTEAGETMLVKAFTPMRARNHVARNAYKVRLATHEELVDLVANGNEVEDATTEETTR